MEGRRAVGRGRSQGTGGGEGHGGSCGGGTDATIKALTRDRDEQRRKLREAMRNDKEAGDWSSTPLPPAVLGLFR